MATEEELKEIIRKKRGGRWIEYHGPYKIGAADVSLPALFSLRLCGGSLLTGCLARLTYSAGNSWNCEFPSVAEVREGG